MYRKHTPTEIVDKIKYNLIKDIGSLWGCDAITNKGEAKNKTPSNIEFQIKLNLNIILKFSLLHFSNHYLKQIFQHF